MTGATLTAIREKYNQGPDGDHVFLLACEVGNVGEAARLAHGIAVAEAHADGILLLTTSSQARVADRLVELVAITSTQAVAW